MRLLVGFASLLLAAIACSSTGGSQASSGPQSPCSTGPAYAWDEPFPAGPSESNDPACVERCGGPYPGVTWGAGGLSFPSLAAVPSGSCAHDGEACTMVAVRPTCNAEASVGIALRFTCGCASGAWSCGEAYFGGGIASCTDAGGADAATD